MGDQNSKPMVNEEFLRSFRNDYKKVGDHRDNRLGNVRLFEGPHSQLVAEKNVMANNKEDVERFLSTNLAKALSTRSKYLMKIHAYKVHQEDSMCGSISSLSTYHEYYQNTVQDELTRRNQVNLFYLESELWAIMYSVVSASAYLEKSKNLPLSDVRPCNIFFTPNGEVKLLPFGIYPEDQTAYQRYFAQNEETLLSPEQLVKIRANSPRSDCDQVKADVYAIGQTMLMCSCLQTNPSCYNFNDNTINPEFVNQLQEFSKSQYSKFFNNIVNVMLSEKPEDRPTPSTIFQILQPFESEILGLKPFNPDYETVKQALAQNGSLPVNQQASNQPQTTKERREEQNYARQATQQVLQQPQLTQQQQIQQQAILQQQLQGGGDQDDQFRNSGGPNGQQQQQHQQQQRPPAGHGGQQHGGQVPMEQFFQQYDQQQQPYQQPQQQQQQQQPMYMSYAQQPSLQQQPQYVEAQPQFMPMGSQYQAAPKYFDPMAQSAVQQQPIYAQNQFQPNQSHAPDFNQPSTLSEIFSNHHPYGVAQQQPQPQVVYQEPLGQSTIGHYDPYSQQPAQMMTSGYPLQHQPSQGFYQPQDHYGGQNQFQQQQVRYE